MLQKVGKYDPLCIIQLRTTLIAGGLFLFLMLNENNGLTAKHNSYNEHHNTRKTTMVCVVGD